MKRALFLLAAFWLTQTLARAEAQVGKPAPDFTGTDIHGKTHRLSDYRGKIVVLEAYNYDCPFCANHYNSGAMPELQKQAASQGVVWLLVNSTHEGHPSYRPAGAAKQEFEKNKIQATAWLDDHSGQIGKAYGMKTTPHIFIIDPQGKLAYQGAVDDRPDSEGDPRQAKKNYVLAAIEQIKAGKKIATAQTKPYGCGIKYRE